LITKDGISIAAVLATFVVTPAGIRFEVEVS
jgi:hypothetical protein